MDGALNVVATAAIGNMVNSAGDAGATLKLRFGNNDNQVSHAFRHVDDAGLDRGAVRDAISNDLSNLGPSLSDGLYKGQVNVGGVDIDYVAYKLPDGTINVGRITQGGEDGIFWHF